MTAPHPLVTRARHLAQTLLAPHAEEVDRTEVPTGHLTEIRRSGLLGLHAPTTAAAVGGGRSLSLPNRAQRLAREALFVMVQGRTRDFRGAHLDALAGR
ncbi:hypothetical protein [Streptomyces sp. NPDC017202]|uniref:hypothetical protein n=1 Tax=Streptomyces sp. NPDC017202 TaxID=3364981 RepID=UPI0037BB7965